LTNHRAQKLNIASGRVCVVRVIANFSRSPSTSTSYRSPVPFIMRNLSLALVFILLAAFINAYEFPFKLPFGFDSIFGTTSGSPELFALHKDLVNFPSVTGSEHDVGVYLEDYLKALNYTVERIPGKYSVSIEVLTRFRFSGGNSREYLCLSREGSKSSVLRPDGVFG
jgi:hypothetical protein